MKVFFSVLVLFVLSMGSVLAVEPTSRVRELRTYDREKMQGAKDLREAAKSERAKNLALRVCTTRTNRVIAWNKQLVTMRSVLAKATTKTAEAKAAGRDVTKIETAASSATVAIGAAETAVTTFGSVVCEATTNSTEAKSAVSGLTSDVARVQEKMISARILMTEVLKVIATVRGEKLTETVKQ